MNHSVSISRKIKGEKMNLLNIKDKKLIENTGNTIKLTIGNETKSYPVYKVDLDLLFYNEYNDRIATWINNYESNPNNESFEGMDEIKKNKIIEQFILSTDPKKMKTTKNNIYLVSQKVPGVVLNDGRIIDGNRRFTCLRQLREEYPQSKDFNYFETAILNLDINNDRKAIKILELNLQHATDEKADYDQIDYAIGTYRTIEIDKTLTLAEYAIHADEPTGKVRERIEMAKLINEYLDFIKMPGQYSYLRERQAYILFQEMLVPLHKCKTEEEEKEFKRMAFTNYMAGSIPDVRKYFRDLSSIMNTEHYDTLINNQEKTIKKIIKEKEKVESFDKQALDKFAKQITYEKDLLAETTEDEIKAYKIGKIKNTPSDVVNKCIFSLRNIDTRLFSSLNNEEASSLDKDIKTLEKTIERIKNELHELHK